MGETVRCRTFLNGRLLNETEPGENGKTISEQLLDVSKKVNEILTSYVHESSRGDTNEVESSSDSNESEQVQSLREEMREDGRNNRIQRDVNAENPQISEQEHNTCSEKRMKLRIHEV